MTARRILGCVLLVLFASISAANAHQDERSRKTLSGLKGVYPIVDPMPEKARAMGVSDSWIRTVVELRLREAAIPVLTRQEAVETTAGNPVLAITSQMAFHEETGIGAYALQFELLQGVDLHRAPEISSIGVTWSKPIFRVVSSDQFVDSVRRSVEEGMDAFVNDYLAANPRPQQAPK